MKSLPAILLFFMAAASVYPFTVKNSFSTELLKRDYTDQSEYYAFTAEDTLSLKTPGMPVFLFSSHYDYKDPVHSAGGGIGVVMPYLDYFYSELSYTFFCISGVPSHRLYADVTFEDSWGYLTLAARADFSTGNVLLSSLGMKNYLPAGVSLWNRYSLAFSSTDEIMHSLWTEIDYRFLPVIGFSAGFSFECPVSEVLPGWEDFEILGGLTVTPSEMFSIGYRLAVQQQLYAFQQRHSLVLRLTFS